MKCRQCGTEIAEKALICYKCGTATTEAKYAPVAIRDGSRPWVPVVLVLVMILFGLYGGFMGGTPEIRAGGGLLAGCGAVFLAIRLIGVWRR